MPPPPPSLSDTTFFILKKMEANINQFSSFRFAFLLLFYCRCRSIFYERFNVCTHKLITLFPAQNTVCRRYRMPCYFCHSFNCSGVFDVCIFFFSFCSIVRYDLQCGGIICLVVLEEQKRKIILMSADDQMGSINQNNVIKSVFGVPYRFLSLSLSQASRPAWRDYKEEYVVFSK